MATQLIPAAAPNVERPFLSAFQALSTREQLRLFEQLSNEFSFSRGHDRIHDAIRAIAQDAAEDDGWRGDDLAARYLEDPHSWAKMAPTVSLRSIEGGR
jgi:hypothetical protein